MYRKTQSLLTLRQASTGFFAFIASCTSSIGLRDSLMTSVSSNEKVFLKKIRQAYVNICSTRTRQDKPDDLTFPCCRRQIADQTDEGSFVQDLAAWAKCIVVRKGVLLDGQDEHIRNARRGIRGTKLDTVSGPSSLAKDVVTHRHLVFKLSRRQYLPQLL